MWIACRFSEDCMSFPWGLREHSAVAHQHGNTFLGITFQVPYFFGASGTLLQGKRHRPLTLHRGSEIQPHVQSAFYDHPETGLPNTNNALEGLFSDLKSKVRVHCGKGTLDRLLIVRYACFDPVMWENNGGMVVITAWWGVWHIISGLTLAYIWRTRGRKEVPLLQD